MPRTAAPESCWSFWSGEVFEHRRSRAARVRATMSHSVSHFLSDLFPDLGHPRYQSVLETISFLIVLGMIAGAFALAIFLLFHAL
jgi:hypothetical protein